MSRLRFIDPGIRNLIALDGTQVEVGAGYWATFEVREVDKGRMEKRRPHYRLDLIKAALAQRGGLAFTSSVRKGVMEMGLSLDQALLVLPVWIRARSTRA